MRSLILGGPGSGKTTYLVNLIEQYLEKGVAPQDIAFVSFTKKAISEAINRCCNKFNLKEKDFSYFRTIHSLAYRQIGMQQRQVFNNSHLKNLSIVTGYELSNRFDDEEQVSTSNAGVKMLFLNDLMRNKRLSPEELMAEVDLDLNLFEFKRFCDIYKRYKQEKGVYDFTDILVNYSQCVEAIKPNIMIVDEAQDLSTLQWRIIDKLSESMDEVYYAGDDDQAIYEWSGADINKFLNLKVDNRKVLPKSYRLPKKIFNLAKDLASRIEDRYEKRWGCRDDEGSIHNYVEFSHVNFNLDETWLVLSRTNKVSFAARRILESRGLMYKTKSGSAIKKDELAAFKLYANLPEKLSRDQQSLLKRFSSKEITKPCGYWYDIFDLIPKSRINYYRTILSNGYKLSDEPNILVDTIHGSKGGEADNVVLFTDVSRDHKSDDRVFYVGVTRARKNLHIILPQGKTFYKVQP